MAPPLQRATDADIVVVPVPVRVCPHQLQPQAAWTKS